MLTNEEFKKQGIVPDVVPKAPEKRVRIAFDSGVEVYIQQIIKNKTLKFKGKSWECVDTNASPKSAKSDMGSRQWEVVHADKDR